MPAVPFKVKAVFEYNSAEPDDLNFPNGQIITVTDDEDADWYTGEYTTAAGDKIEGLFPRNFVEKYEPAIPSRPARTPRKVTAPEPPPEPAATQEPEPAKEAEIDPPHQSNRAEEAVVSSSPPAAPQPTAAVPAAAKAVSPPSTAPKPGPPPVAEKPSSNSFKDRIAAFNKAAAPPIAPFKPGGQSTASGFVKKPFVAPPPSKNSYVPPPREPPPQKVYRREEDPSLQHEAEKEAPEPPPAAEEPTDDQPKPTSLKERIALLQKQQLEQAQRHAESGQKKDKPKKPPKKRLEPAEEAELPLADEHLEQVDTNETIGRKPAEVGDEATEDVKPPPARQPSFKMPTPLPPRELVSDTNDADDSGAADTEDAPGTSTEEDRPRSKGTTAISSLEPVPPKKEEAAAPEEEPEEQGSEEEEEESEEDPEVRRKRELRERMAKMSGGMGMMGMLGGPAGMPSAGAPRKSRPSTEGPRQSSEQHGQEEMARAPPVPIMALPGMSNQTAKKAEEADEAESDEEGTAQSTPHDPRKDIEAPNDYISQAPKRTSTGRSSASIPQERAVPPPPPREVRAPPPPPPTETRAVPPLPQSPTSRAVPPPPPLKTTDDPGEESDDEDMPQPTPRAEEVPTSPTAAPPVPSRPEPSKPPPAPRDTYQSPVSPPQTRAPPPPPPGQVPSRKSTNDSHGAIGPRPQANEDSDEEVTEYEGDYDTDIASSAKHKDALKSHNRDSSIDDDVLTDDAAAKSPSSPPARAVPPVPPVSAPRDVPPPPPPATSKSRKSTDVPRAPPPIPPSSQLPHDEDDNDYDPYRYSAPQHGMPSPPNQAPYAPMLSSPREEIEEQDMYSASAQPPRMPPPPPTDRTAPPPPPPPSASALPEPPKQSIDGKRSTNMPRRSMEAPRPSGEHGSIASDLDLGRSSFWWTQDKLPPPALQQRNDILFEMESSTSSKRGGKSMVSKDIYVLYQDYSQTTINATFDASDPSHVVLEQTHERPPPAPRKDQLEGSSEQFGARIAAAASSAATSGITVGDGSPQGLIHELLRPLAGALKPVGTRAYGALVYANLANASTQQFDEIRPGDVITFRNAKFSGHKGGLHSKYSQDVGKPDHVAVVIDWDGTKKKIRAWEQVSREEKGKKAKVKEESFKVGDLKSGEVRVWRVMGRSWVGWDKN